MTTQLTDQLDAALIYPPSVFTTLWQSVVLLAAFFMGQLAGVAIAAPWVLPQLHQASIADKVLAGSTNGTVTAFAVMMTLLFVLVVAVILIRWQGNRVKDYLAIRAFNWRQLIFTSVLLLVLNVIINAIGVWLDRDPMVFMDELAATAQPFWLLGIAMVLVAPIYEEIIFRGFMWTSLASSAVGSRRLGIWVASIITSVVFAFIHFQYGWVELLSIVMLAMLFSYARYLSGSLLLPIILHIANNSLAMWQYLAIQA